VHEQETFVKELITAVEVEFVELVIMTGAIILGA
jgi:hypothetical protein